ncbi:hypothetical protein ACOMHN_044594 [Nucella lapillus]
MLMMRAKVQGHRWVDHPAAAVMEARVPGQWVDRPAAMVMEAREQGRCWIDLPAAAVMEARVQGRHWVDRPSDAKFHDMFIHIILEPRESEALEGSQAVMENSYGVGDGEGSQSRLCLWNHPGTDVTGMVARCEKVASTCAELLGGEVYHYHTKLMMKEAFTGGKHVWHQNYGATRSQADNAEEVFIIQINTLQATTCVACTSKFKTFRVHMGTAVLHSMEVSDTASPVRYTFMADQFDRSLRKIVMVIRFPNVPSTRTTERQILPNQPPSSSSTTTGMTSRMSPASSSPPRCAESCQEALEVLLKDKA